MSEEQVVLTDTTSAPVEEAGQPETSMESTAPESSGQPVQEQEVSSSSAPQEGGQPDAKAQEAARREAGALAQAQQRLVEYEQRLKNIESKALETPEKAKQSLMEFNGLSEVEANQKVAELLLQGMWRNPTPQVAPQYQQPMVDPYQAVEEVLRAKEFEKVLLSTVDKLKQSYPELQQPNVNQNPETILTIDNADKLARARMQVMPNLSYPEAVILSYGEITGKNAEEIQKARENGRLQGLAEANSVNGAKAPESQVSNIQSRTTSLSASEQSLAKRAGLTAEQWSRVNKNEDTYLE